MSCREVWAIDRNRCSDGKRQKERKVASSGKGGQELLSAIDVQGVGYCQQERCGRRRGDKGCGYYSGWH